ncbi:unnamed protein product [Closterium sp. NIES-65]|nr:unnamed protein product [Closterium sp. NIES-65]
MQSLALLSPIASLAAISSFDPGSHHEGIQAAGAGAAGQSMKAFKVLGLGTQDTVHYARAGGGGVALPHLSSFPLSPLPPTFPPSPPAPLHAAMKAFALLGLGAQDIVQYVCVGEVGGDGAGDNDHDLDPLDHDSHNHVASSAGGASLPTRESPLRGSSSTGRLSALLRERWIRRWRAVGEGGGGGCGGGGEGEGDEGGVVWGRCGGRGKLLLRPGAREGVKGGERKGL